MNPDTVWMIDPVGGHRGMHYYDFALCEALIQRGTDEILYTCDETESCSGPEALRVRYPFRHIFGSDPAPLRALRYFIGLVRLARAAARERPSIAHLHYFLLIPADLWFLRVMKRLGVRIVMTVHDVVPFSARLLERALMHRVYALADGVIVHTKQTEEELRDRFDVESSEIRVIPHGHYLPYTDSQDASREQARAELALDSDRPVVLFFGQIKREKGLDVLLRAMTGVVQTHPDALLLVAGQVYRDGWEHYQDLVKELDITAHVRARIEHIPDDDVPLYFSAADVVALPYRKIYQSGVLLMAWSYSRPVVASETGGLAETVSHGKTGLLVPPGDAGVLADAISQLLADGAAARGMGRAGRKQVELEYSWDLIAERTEELYRAVLGRAS